MDNIFDFTLLKLACEDIFEDEIAAQTSDHDEEIVLSDDQIGSAADKILNLPDAFQEVLMSRMCFGFSERETEEIFGIVNPKKLFDSARIILGYSLMLQEREKISLDSLKHACELALDTFSAQVNSNTGKGQPFHNKAVLKKFIRSRKKITPSMLFVRRASIFLAGVLITGVMALTVSAALRERVYQWLVNVYEKYSSFSIVTENSEMIASIDLNQISFGFMPDGFELVEKYVDDAMLFVKYINPDNKQVYLRVVIPNDEAIDANTEGVTIEQVIINNHEANYWMKNGVTYLLWEEKGHLFAMYTEFELETATKIAENIHFPAE